MAENRFRIKIPKIWMLIGAASYSIYLIHNPLQSLVARVLQGEGNWFLTFTACCVASVSAGIVYHLIYERPMLRFLSRKTRVNVENKRYEFTESG